MTERYAETVWNGTLREGNGTMKTGTGLEAPFTWASRFEEERGSNPEELIAAAHAGCFSMDLSGRMTKAGFKPERVSTRANVTLERVDGKPRITRIHLVTEAKVPEIDEGQFKQFVEDAREGCPISAALAAVPQITVDAKLVK